MKQEQEEINPFEYQYKPNDVVELPANVLLNVMHFCQKVLQSQPTLAVPYVYPTNVVENRNNKGVLETVDVDWKTYQDKDMTAFFNSASNPIPIATELTILSEQVFHAFSMKHLENIQKGVAKKTSKLTKEEEDENFAQLLANKNKGEA